MKYKSHRLRLRLGLGIELGLGLGLWLAVGLGIGLGLGLRVGFSNPEAVCNIHDRCLLSVMFCPFNRLLTPQTN